MNGTEFLVHIVLDGSAIPDDQLQRLRQAETERAVELAAAGHLKRIWRLTEGWSNVGVWVAVDEEALRAVLDTLPLRGFMTIDVKQLLPHPNDPASSADEKAQS